MYLAMFIVVYVQNLLNAYGWRLVNLRPCTANSAHIFFVKLVKFRSVGNTVSRPNRAEVRWFICGLKTSVFILTQRVQSL